MRKLISILYMGLTCCVLFSCNKLLSEQVPQATLSDEQAKDPANAEGMVVAAYAIFTSATSAPTTPTRAVTEPATVTCSTSWKSSRAF